MVTSKALEQPNTTNFYNKILSTKDCLIFSLQSQYCCLQRLTYPSSWPRAPSTSRPGADLPCSLCTARLKSPWSPDWCSSGGTPGPAWPSPRLNRVREKRKKRRASSLPQVRTPREFLNNVAKGEKIFNSVSHRIRHHLWRWGGAGGFVARC